ncbi:MAG: histone deacetylase family protein [Candidatus Bathyarchaeia archaeon]
MRKYDFGQGHPFRGDRFPKYISLLKEKGIISREGVNLVKPKPARNDDLLLVHSKEYVERVMELASRGGQLSMDTPLSPSVLEAARLIAGSALKAASLVTEGGYDVVDAVGGGLHHAGRDYGGGFCVFNDVAICARSLLDRHEQNRVVIFDTDVHAGNGTMDIFYEDPEILFISVHQDPKTLYPGTGFTYQIGRGRGEGYTVNIPLPPGSGDICIKLILDDLFIPLVEQFNPDVIIRNGGPDAHINDSLGGLAVTYKGFHTIGLAVREASKKVDAPIINMSCSGYNPDTVTKGMYAILAGILKIDMDLEEDYYHLEEGKQLEETKKILEELSNRLAQYWDI